MRKKEHPGDVITLGSKWYMLIHSWMSNNYGNPKYCESENCKKISSRYNWANISGNYYRDRADWKRLCVSCHRLLDYGNKCKRGHSLSGDNLYIAPKTKIRGCLICRRESARKHSKLRYAL